MGLVIHRINKGHDRRDFDCGNASLNDYLRNRARRHDAAGHSRTFILAEEDDPGRVIGYFTICPGAVEFPSVPPELSKFIPRHRIPTLLLARLAVRRSVHGHGYGSVMILQAMRKGLQLRDHAGCSLIEVDAIDEKAMAFYQRFGFVSGLSDRFKLFMPIGKAQKIVESAVASRLL